MGIPGQIWAILDNYEFFEQFWAFWANLSNFRQFTQSRVPTPTEGMIPKSLLPKVQGSLCNKDNYYPNNLDKSCWGDTKTSNDRKIYILFSDRFSFPT